MKKYCLLLVTTLICTFSGNSQIVGTDVFLQGRYVEIGMLRNGAFGAGSVPAGYHPRTSIAGGGSHLAEVYDIGHDGWAVGTPAYMGDYTYHGSPFEGWGLEVAGARSHAFVPGSFSHGAGGSLTGNITGYANSGGVARAFWSGTAAGGQLVIDMETRVDTNASHVKINVKLKNTGSVSLPGVYLLRSCDPDVGAGWPGGSFGTNNRIISQAGISDRVLVAASSSGAYTTASLGLGAKDSRAKAFIYNWWSPPVTVSFADIYAQTVTGSGPYYYDSVNHPGDIAIGLIFNLGTIAAGDSTTLSYAYIFDGTAGFDSAFAPACTGTPLAGTVSANTSTACSTTGIVLNLSGYSAVTGLTFQWQSSPDSVTWTDVSGATGTGYSFSGLTATTFYRCRVTCTPSSSAAYTAGKKITYTTACPCLHTAGIVNPNTNSACATTAIVLSNTGYTSATGVALQWQSSPDSVTWSDIAGATMVPFSFTGLSATTYYRLKATCIATSLQLFSDVRKITFTSICACSGTPVVTTATASTSYCSGCSLVLNITGLASMSGYTYQWQRSLSAASGWGNISGATTATYTHSPSETYYYRCNVTCSNSGLTNASSSVLVITPHSIIEDSVRQAPDTACSGQLFFIKASGISPLLSVKTFFGDGTTLSASLLVSGGNSYTNFPHYYVAPGAFTVKQILYCDTVAQDSITFTYTHSYCNVLSLKFYIDANTSCAKESTEYFSNHPVLLRVDSNGTAIDTISALSGIYYKVFAPSGTIYSFTLLSGAMYAVCPSGGVIHDTILSGTSTYDTKYMGLYCSSSAFDLAEYVTFFAHTNMGRATILSRNLLCSPQAATQVINYSPKYRYTSAGSYSTPYPSLSSDYSVSWDLAPLSCAGPATLITTRARKATSMTLTIGDTVHTNFMIGPITGDGNVSNNIIDRVDTVRGPFDPNMIEVTPPGCFDYDTILQYTIHFENLGNDTAHNVHVLDTISANLDFRSIEILASSAEMDVYPYEEAGLRIIKFDFPNIKLLDSSWHGLNEGMFVYKIKTKAGLATGSSILNRVGIYFDHAEVVMTNTVQNLKGCPVPPPASVGQFVTHNILVYPNPATDELTIKTEPGTFTFATITNTIGQQMLQQWMTGAVTVMSVKALPAGLYYVTLKGEMGTQVRKFMKL